MKKSPRFVRITNWGLPVWLDPLGMLQPQVVANLSQQVCVSVDFVGHWLYIVAVPLAQRQSYSDYDYSERNKLD
jgi:hypothetical protein